MQADNAGMVIIALDVGERRIGVAVSDPSGTLATPHGIIERRSRSQDFATIAELVRRLGAQRVIVGLPISLDGTIGPQARRVMRYAQALARALSVPIEMVDERYSTALAQALLSEAGRRTRAQLDAAAAAVILQEYLDHRT
ncbi:MAG: Holliday junction resolvase RuvX [Anaerolineae bacterium]|nr:Holliday junction resolvase RuvX [Anaerolineae bacterium]MDW8070996.1 Holliday junction resolvase RuvX [Anaerolineae bacterium]